MRDEKVGQVQAEMSSKRQSNPMQSHRFSNSDRIPRHNQHNKQSPIPKYGKRRTTDSLSDEESNCQDGVTRFNLHARGMISIENGVNFNVVQSISIGVSDDEQSNSCPLKFWSLHIVLTFFLHFYVFKGLAFQFSLKRYFRTIHCIRTPILSKTWIHDNFRPGVLLRLLI